MNERLAVAGGETLGVTTGQVDPSILPATANDTNLDGSPFQVMPPLSDEEYAALREDIAERGVLVPVVVDQYGNTLDGHHRQRIAAELGVDCPTEVRHVADDGEARDLALTLNLARRHLTREQKRALIADQIARDPAATDRSIARRLRCSPSTVGAVRRGEVSNLDTPMTRREEAEARSDRIRAGLHEWDHDILVALLRGVPPSMMADCMLEALARVERQAHDREIRDAFRDHIAMPRIRAVLAWPNGGYYADDIASVGGDHDELRDLLDAQRKAAAGDSP